MTPGMGAIRAVIFDLDGTLVDSTPSHVSSWLEACELAGLPRVPRELVEGLMGRTSHDIAAEILRAVGRDRSLARELAELKDRLFAEKYAKRVPLIEGAREVLRELKAVGIKVCVVSSNPRELILRVLRATGLSSYVDAVVGQDEVERGKPDPAPILLALARLSARPNEAAVVGDSVYDVLAAKRAGVAAMGITRSDEVRREMLRSGASAVVGSIREIVGLVINR